MQHTWRTLEDKNLPWKPWNKGPFDLSLFLQTQK